MKLRRILIVVGIVAAVLLIATILIFTGAWIPNQPSQADYPVRGIDVSHHQGEIEWDKVAAAGIRFAYIKATEGADYDDPNFKRNWDGAAAAHIARGAYHFFTLGSPGRKQAEHFLSQIFPYSQALPPAVDIELTGGNHAISSPEQFQRELSDFIATVEARLGTEPVIYSSRDFRKRYLQGGVMKSWWISDVIFAPKQEPGEEWKFWQYSWRGKIPGITGFADLDVFAGSARELEGLTLPLADRGLGAQ